MCPPGCLHSICETATRRGLLKTGFTLGVGALAASATKPVFAATPAPLTINEMVDLSHALYEGFPTFSGDKWFTVENIVNFKKDKVNVNRWTMMEHTGTHMDAPIHFSADGKTADLLPLSDLLVPAAVIDISARAAENPDTSLTPDDIKAWEAKNGPLPEGCAVIMNSGWHKLVGDPKFTNKSADGKNHVPGFHVEAAQMLIGERSGQELQDVLVGISRMIQHELCRRGIGDVGVRGTTGGNREGTRAAIGQGVEREVHARTVGKGLLEGKRREVASGA